MDLRSDFIFGKDIFIKIVKIETNVSKILSNALQNSNYYLPFAAKEMVMSYLLSLEKDLITPRTKVLVSTNNFTILNFEKYKEYSYDMTLKELKKNFIEFEDYLSNIKEIKEIKTGVIISEKLDGNFDTFLNTQNKEEFEDAFIHLSSLFYKYQKKYKAIHGDPKTANYTWKKLIKPIDINYKFEDKIIKRKNVKNLFYFTDLEFVYSPVIKSKKIKEKIFYFNFSKKYEWMNDDRKNLIYIPKISFEFYYDYNVNLYGGYNQKIIKEKGNIKEIFGLLPRFLTIDILLLIKMILTWYPELLSSSLLRKLNLFFTRFLTLSEKEKEFRYQVDYSPVSTTFFANLLNSN